MTPEPQLQRAESSAPESRLSIFEKRAMFDWTIDRRSRVIGASKKNLSEFLALRPHIDIEVKHVTDLWENVIHCFTEQNSPNHTNILLANNQFIEAFEPSSLPTHSEYHIAKVVTLTTKLFNLALEMDYRNDENALALSLSAVIHDIGPLLKNTEKGPQEKMYAQHELRAISLVDPIIDALYVGKKVDEATRLRLKNKVKMLIAATIPKWNLFGEQVKINQIIEGSISERDFMDDLQLADLPTDDQELSEMKKNMRTEAVNLFQIYSNLNPSQQQEMKELSRIMAAADHGAYMLEPCRLAEVMGLWQELNKQWRGKNGELVHRSFTQGIEKAYAWLSSGYPVAQWKKHGETLKKIGISPFMEDGSQTIEQAENYCNIILELLKIKPARDDIVRFEGFFSPVQLAELAEKLGISDRIFNDKVQKFSDDFAQRFAAPHDFDKLSTDSLRYLYEHASDKTVFLKEALTYIVINSQDELQENGKMNIHIAPYAYDSYHAHDFLTHLSRAYNQLDKDVKKYIDKIFLTMREDQNDPVDEVSAQLWQYSSTPFGISLGGMPKSTSLEQRLSDIQSQKPTQTVIHFGLEENYELLEKRLTSLLTWLKKPGNAQYQSAISIHIDDGYDSFNTYYDGHAKNRDPLVALTKSVSPLGYLLANGSQGFDNYATFCNNFTNVNIGSHNPAMTGEVRTIAQSFALAIVRSTIHPN